MFNVFEFLRARRDVIIKWLLTGSLIIAIVAFLVVVGFTIIEARRRADMITDLQNQLAQSSQTIETQKGVFEKLTVQSHDLQSILNDKDKQLEDLKKTLKKRDEQILTANQIAIHWRSAYEARFSEGVVRFQPRDGGVVEVPNSDGGTESFSDPVVQFQHDFGPFIVSGMTVASDPPQAFLRVEQGRPLRIRLLVTQAEDKSWKTYVTSSEENMAVDVELSGVNPFILDKKWYENIGIVADLGYADGLLVGVGVTYKIGHFHVGPKAWVSISDRFGKYFGITATWMPFER